MAVQFICPLARKSSIRISHSKKVQQQNLPQQNSPVLQYPTAEKSSSRISHLKIVQYQNLPHQKSPVTGALYLVFPIIVTVIHSSSRCVVSCFSYHSHSHSFQFFALSIYQVHNRFSIWTWLTKQNSVSKSVFRQLSPGVPDLPRLLQIS